MNNEKITIESLTYKVCRKYESEINGLIERAFLSKFGISIHEVEDKEELERISYMGTDSFRYRGITFLYVEYDMGFTFDSEKYTVTTKIRFSFQ